jgi:hypothetical protein
MAKINDLLHEIGNWHNKISLGAGIARMELEHDFKDKPMPPEIKNTLGKLIQLEHNTIEANASLKQLKNAIYEIIDPETDQKKEKI